MNIRDLLEGQIIKDAHDGDTTVLADLLERFSDEVIYNALSDENQKKTEMYNEIQHKLKCLEIVKNNPELVEQFKTKYNDLSDELTYQHTITLIQNQFIKAAAIKLILKLAEPFLK